MSKILIFSMAICVLSIVFSLFSISFSFDVSLISFPFSLCVSLLVSYFLLYKGFVKKNFRDFRIGRKILQYIPYLLLVSFIIRRAGAEETPFWLDVVCVVMWILIFVLSIVLLKFISDKKTEKYFPFWQKELQLLQLERKVWSVKRVFIEIVDWVDALLQAVFMVLLIQIFIFQLYVIPSESMVPSFLIGDRVVVFKTPSAPVFPLSKVGLPSNKKYNRGDVVVFRNPHYSINRKSEIQTVVSQLVYMITFTGINLNVDENGNLKADPLVKRISGLPGEQLVMQDGILYARTAKNAEFQPVELDQSFACWNLNETQPSIKKYIQTIPFSNQTYKAMIELENLRKDYDLDVAKTKCENITKKIKIKYDSGEIDAFFAKSSSLKKNETIFEGGFSFQDFVLQPEEFIEKIFKSGNCCEWFTAFMNDWNKVDSSVYSSDPYTLANFKLNVMIKEIIGNYILNYLEKKENQSEEAFMLQYISFYIQILDQRNMPLFPANDEQGNPSYIPEDCYFMMGDNRFNSLDMRHSYESKLVPLSSLDTYSVLYESNMEPQFVPKNYILGSAAYRFWPFARKGFVKTK